MSQFCRNFVADYVAILSLSRRMSLMLSHDVANAVVKYRNHVADAVVKCRNPVANTVADCR